MRINNSLIVRGLCLALTWCNITGLRGGRGRWGRRGGGLVFVSPLRCSRWWPWIITSTPLNRTHFVTNVPVLCNNVTDETHASTSNVIIHSTYQFSSWVDLWRLPLYQPCRWPAPCRRCGLCPSRQFHLFIFGYSGLKLRILTFPLIHVWLLDAACLLVG